MKKWVALAFMMSVINENIRKLTSQKPSTLVWNIPRKKKKKTYHSKIWFWVIPSGKDASALQNKLQPLRLLKYDLPTLLDIHLQKMYRFMKHADQILSWKNISDIFNCLRLWNSLIYFAQRASEISTFLMCWGLLWVLWGNKNGFWELLSVLKYFVVAIEITSIGPFCSKLQGKEA